MAPHCICEIESCNKPARTKKLCQGHYLRKLRHGDPLGGRQPVNVGSCRVENCEKPAKVTGMCWQHYTRIKRHNDLEHNQRGESLRWLKDHANHSDDECLTYPFMINRYGYGHLSNPSGKGSILASRMMCILAHGEPPHSDSYACHSCHKGNQGCVNPRHLYWGDNRSNQMDRVDAGNSNRGSRHGRSILSESDVIKIRSLQGLVPPKEIAAQYGVSKSAIYLIMQRRTWAWL